MQLGCLPNRNTLEQTETEYCGKGSASCIRVQHPDEKLSRTVRKSFLFQAGRMFCLPFLVSFFSFPLHFSRSGVLAASLARWSIMRSWYYNTGFVQWVAEDNCVPVYVNDVYNTDCAKIILFLKLVIIILKIIPGVISNKYQQQLGWDIQCHTSDFKTDFSASVWVLLWRQKSCHPLELLL